MQKIMTIFTLYIIATCVTFSQGWNSYVNTSRTSDPLTQVDIVTTKTGNHIALWDYAGGDNKIYFITLNSSGSILRDTLIASNAFYANITGSNDTLFLVYAASNGDLKVKRSINSGAIWSDISPGISENISIEEIYNLDNYELAQSTPSTVGMSQLDAVYRDNKLHVVWASVGEDGYETYYNQYQSIGSPDWVYTIEPYNITNETPSQVGGRPRIALSSIVHVSFNTNPPYGTNIRTRDCGTDGTSWASGSMSVFSGYSFNEKLFADNDTVFLFYYKLEQHEYYNATDLYVIKRGKDASSWSSTVTLIKDTTASDANVFVTKTIDGKMHVIYISYHPGSLSVDYRNYNNGSWSSSLNIASGVTLPQFIGLSSVSNDLYTIWCNYSGGISTLYFRQYDALPTSPTVMSIGSSNQVTVNWAWNPEPDINNYELWRKYFRSRFDQQDWTLKASPTTNSWTDPDFELDSPGDHYTVSYKTRSKDKANQLSGYSSEISTDAVMIFQKNGGITKQVMPTEYSLEQNYPNPFNPTTTIDYSIPQESNVSVKVFDHIGREVASLINRNQNAGFYSTTFDASRLSSGVYFYKITAGNYSATKKMLLMK